MVLPSETEYNKLHKWSVRGMSELRCHLERDGREFHAFVVLRLKKRRRPTHLLKTLAKTGIICKTVFLNRITTLIDYDKARNYHIQWRPQVVQWAEKIHYYDKKMVEKGRNYITVEADVPSEKYPSPCICNDKCVCFRMMQSVYDNYNNVCNWDFAFIRPGYCTISQLIYNKTCLDKPVRVPV